MLRLQAYLVDQHDFGTLQTLHDLLGQRGIMADKPIDPVLQAAEVKAVAK